MAGPWSPSLSLNRKLVLMMVLLSLTLVGSLLLLSFRTEQNLYTEFMKYTADLSKAIKIGMKETSSAEIIDPASLQEHLKRLNTKGVKEISIISTSDRIVTSTRPENVGKWISNRKKELIVKAEMGEPVSGEGPDFNVILPVQVDQKTMGYIHLEVSNEDFAVLIRRSIVRRVMVAGAIFGLGIILSVYLARRYTSPIQELAGAVNAVASGDLSPKLPQDRTDEIGALARSFNHLVDRLREEKGLREKLRTAEHLAGIGQLSREIAHEIKNPLNFISLSIDHMRTAFAPCSEAEAGEFESLVGNIKSEIQRLSRFAGSFLEYSRPLELNLVPSDLASLVESALELATPTAESQKIRIVTELEERPRTLVDPEFFKTCLYNVLLNSIQAMPDGGVLHLRTQESDARCSVVIQDTGTGVKVDDLLKIFTPFFTTRKGGLGLGLAFTQRVIEEHGGKMDFFSKENEGTRVIFHLPRREA